MSDWLKANTLHVLITLCVTGVAAFWIHNSYRLAEIRAEVEKVKAVEGKKLRFGVTKEKSE